MLIRLAALSIAAALPGAAAAAEPLQPTGKWVADFGESQCIAHRNYGTEEKPLHLVLKAPPLGSTMQLMVMRKGSRTFAEQADARITFDDQRPIPTTMLAFGGSKSTYRTNLVNLPLSEFERIRTAKAVSIFGRGQINQAFALSSIPNLLKVVNECVASLRDYWNIAPEGTLHPRLRQGATGDLRRLFSPDDYPSAAITDWNEGTTAFVLLINEQGRVADCSVIQTSGAATLDAQSCAVAKERARFTPAVGVDGKPARHAFVQRITWRLE